MDALKVFAIKWQLKQHISDSVVFLFGIYSCHISKEVQQPSSNNRCNQTAPSSLFDGCVGIGNMYGVQYLEHFTIYVSK